MLNKVIRTSPRVHRKEDRNHAELLLDDLERKAEGSKETGRDLQIRHGSKNISRKFSGMNDKKLICTECGKRTNQTTSSYYSKGKFIIGKDEHLCRRCASKRKGYRVLKQIHDERK